MSTRAYIRYPDPEPGHFDLDVNGDPTEFLGDAPPFDDLQFFRCIDGRIFAVNFPAPGEARAYELGAAGGVPPGVTTQITSNHTPPGQSNPGGVRRFIPADFPCFPPAPAANQGTPSRKAGIASTARMLSETSHLGGPVCSVHPATQSVPYSPFVRYDDRVPKWCTVTVSDGEGRRYSLDLLASSSYDAAHLYLTHVKEHPECGFPIPTTSTTFEVVAGGRLLRVPGARLKTWIENRRRDWRGPRGVLFSKRPQLGH